MAQRMLSFIYNRAPRATGLSDKAIDEHKELIRDLYLTQNYTRDQVIANLKTDRNFNLSPDQFSKAIRRWGFRKQFHSGKSTQPSPNTTASADTTTTTPSNDLSCAADGEHPATTLDSCPLTCPPEMQPEPIIDLDDIQIDGDGDIIMSSPTEDKTIEPSQLHNPTGYALLSAEYLACCYHYIQAFNYYSTILMSFEVMHSYKERRARILDMARVASTRRTCELVRLMLETELEMSNDPLNEKGHSRSSPKEAEMCRMQSFLFHRHLAQIYTRQNDGASMQKHLDIARNFSNAFDIHGTESIDLWTLLFFVQDKKDSQIPELLDSLQWDYESYRLDIDHCLQHCWRKLNPTKSLHEASITYDAGRRTRTEPTDMSDLVLQNSSLHLWKRSSILFTLLWEETQPHGILPWVSRHPTILMIVSRIIVKRSCVIAKHPDDLQEEPPANIHSASLQLYCDALLGLFYDNLFTPDEIKREFVTQFIEHHAWSPPSGSRSALASKLPPQRLDYQIIRRVTLESLLATKKNLKTMEERTTSTKANENRRASTDNDSRWLGEHQAGRVDNYFGNVNSPQFKTDPPLTSDSSYLTSQSSHLRHLATINGNPTISRTLASHSSCSSKRSYSSSLQRFKAAAISLQHQPELTMVLSENPDVLMGEDFLENLQMMSRLGKQCSGMS